jgi:hypothetical protein
MKHCKLHLKKNRNMYKAYGMGAGAIGGTGAAAIGAAAATGAALAGGGGGGAAGATAGAATGGGPPIGGLRHSEKFHSKFS